MRYGSNRGVLVCGLEQDLRIWIRTRSRRISGKKCLRGGFGVGMIGILELSGLGDGKLSELESRDVIYV